MKERGARNVELTDFERDVTIGILVNAINGWDGDQARQNAASRVVAKLREVDRIDSIGPWAEQELPKSHPARGR